MHDAGVCCLVTRQGHLLYQQSRREPWGWGEDSNSWNPLSSKLFLPLRQSRTRTETLCRADRNLMQWNGLYGNTPPPPHPVHVSWRSVCYQPPCFWKVILLSQPHLLPETLWQVTAAHWRSSVLQWCQRSCPVRCRFRGWCQHLCRIVASPHSYRMF